jgi:LysM repeat protein
MSFTSKLAIFGFILFSLTISVAQADDFAAGDSIGVQRVGDKTFILHRVSDQETLFSISRRYKVAMGDIQGANEALKQGLKVGETILVPFGQVANPVSTAATAPAASPVASPPVVTAPVATAPVVATTPVGTKTPAAVSSPSQETTPPAAAPPAKPKATTRTSTITHKVKSGESLYVVAKKYNVSIKDLKAWNSLKADKVTVGQALKIQRTVAVADTESTPTASTTSVASSTKKEEVKKEEKLPAKKEEVSADKKVASGSSSTSASSAQPGEWIAHTVKSGESLFLLAKQYGSSIEELIQWNALRSNNLKVGQSIKVGRATQSAVTIPTVGETVPSGGGSVPTAGESMPTASESVPSGGRTIPSGDRTKTPASLSTQSTTSPTRSSRPAVSTSSTSTSPATAAPSSATASTTTETTSAPNTSGGFSNNKETGLAELIPNTSGNKKYLVLHRTAPVGSVIRVKNEENDLTIFARVVGVLPETGDNAKLLIKLSQAAFDQLKGVNQRFPVEILY